MKAFLLAAGLGTRLRPLTEKTPKPLLPIGGVPLICFALARLRGAGVREIGINLHHLPEQIPAALGDGAKLGVALHYFREPVLLGTGGAVRNAKEFLGDDSFLLWNADTILDLDVAALAAEHSRHGAIATLALSERGSVEEFGGIRYGEKGRILGLQRARGRSEPLPESSRVAVFAGASMLSPRSLGILEEGGEAPCILRDGVLPAIERGEIARVWLSEGYFADLGTPQRLEETNAVLEARGEIYELWKEAKSSWELLAR